MHAFVLLSVLAMTGCAPYQAILYNQDGNVRAAIQSDGMWHKAKNIAQQAKLPNGVELNSIVEESDGVTGPQGAFDMKTTLGLAGFLRDERVNKSNNDLALGLKKEETAQIPLKAEGEAKVIGANAAAAQAE